MGELEERAVELLEGGASLEHVCGENPFQMGGWCSSQQHGQMPYFIEFLKTSGRFDELVKECPLSFTSSNAPRKRDALETMLL